VTKEPSFSMENEENEGMEHKEKRVTKDQKEAPSCCH